MVVIFVSVLFLLEYKTQLFQRSRKNSETELDMCNRPVTVGVYSFLENSYVFEGYRVLQFLEDYIKGGLDKTVYGLSFGREIQLKEGCKLYLSGR